MTNREQQAEIVERCSKAMGLFYSGNEDPEYTEVLGMDLTRVVPAVAGPARPQDRISLTDLKGSFATILGCDYERDTDMAHISKYHDESGSRTTRPDACAPRKKTCDLICNGEQIKLCDGNIVIAAITSCTNTSNPYVLLGAALVAKKAVEKGLKVPAFVKTSLAPGSKVVIDYLKDAGLMPYLEKLGFHLTAFGCTTCIGNSGPLSPEIDEAVTKNDLTVAAVLSGNRNFEARIHQRVKANFLASPMLVVAFALAGRIDIDLTTEPVAMGPDDDPVYLKDIWPSSKEIEDLARKHVKQRFFKSEYEQIFDGDEFWQKLKVTKSTTFKWDKKSTYIKKPPYFERFPLQVTKPKNVTDAKVLLLLGDSVTTDHISPAGAIPETYPAGKYLVAKNVAPRDFNSYGSRRGNHDVMAISGSKTGWWEKKKAAIPSNILRAAKCSSTMPRSNTRPKTYRWSSWEAKNMAQGPPGTGQLKEPACLASGWSSPNPTKGFTAAIWWAWVRCRWCSKKTKAGKALGWMAPKHFLSAA